MEVSKFNDEATAKHRECCWADSKIGDVKLTIRKVAKKETGSRDGVEVG